MTGVLAGGNLVTDTHKGKTMGRRTEEMAVYMLTERGLRHLDLGLPASRIVKKKKSFM